MFCFSNEIQSYGGFDFSSDDNFYDFDSFLNFGNKHGAKTDSAGSEDRPKPQTDDNFSPNLQPLQTNWRQASTVRKNIPKPVTLRSRQKQKKPIRNRVSEIELPEISTDTTLKSVDWAMGSPFSKFDSFLDDRNSINSDWYPWKENHSKDARSQPNKPASGQSFIQTNSNGGKSRKTTPASSNVKTPKKKTTPPKKLNLNNLDKATVREICQSTRMRHVKNLCIEYSLALPTKATTVLPIRKTKWPKKRKRTRKPKPVSQRKSALKQYKPDKLKAKEPLFFKPNSFQKRRTQHSLFDSISSLLWPPADLFRTPVTLTSSKNPSSGRRSDQTLSSRKGWLGSVLNSYGFV